MKALVLALLGVVFVPLLAGAEEATMTMKKLTPVLMVEEIEPCLPFWVERLGFQKVTEVPEGDKLGFVILAKGNVQVMYQSRASLEKDVPALAKMSFKSSTGLFIEVEKISEVVERLKGVEVVVPLRETFYGATEISVRTPCGNLVTFAEFAARK